MTCRILYLNSDFSSREERNSSTLSLVIFLWPLTLCHRSWAWSWGLSECHWRRAGKTSWTANAPVLQPGPWELTQQWRWGHTGPVLQRREAEVKVHDTTHTMKAQRSIKAPHTCVTCITTAGKKMWPGSLLFTRYSFWHLTETYSRAVIYWLKFGIILHWLTDKFKDRERSPKRHL